jgi:hypothetical protein
VRFLLALLLVCLFFITDPSLLLHSFWLAAASVALSRSLLIAVGTDSCEALARWVLATGVFVDAFEIVAQHGLINYWCATFSPLYSSSHLPISNSSLDRQDTISLALFSAGEFCVKVSKLPFSPLSLLSFTYCLLCPPPSADLQQGLPGQPTGNPRLAGTKCVFFFARLDSLESILTFFSSPPSFSPLLAPLIFILPSAPPQSSGPPKLPRKAALTPPPLSSPASTKSAFASSAHPLRVRSRQRRRRARRASLRCLRPQYRRCHHRPRYVYLFLHLLPSSRTLIPSALFFPGLFVSPSSAMAMRRTGASFPPSHPSFPPLTFPSTIASSPSPLSSIQGKPFPWLAHDGLELAGPATRRLFEVVGEISEKKRKNQLVERSEQCRTLFLELSRFSSSSLTSSESERAAFDENS